MKTPARRANAKTVSTRDRQVSMPQRERSASTSSASTIIERPAQASLSDGDTQMGESESGFRVNVSAITARSSELIGMVKQLSHLQIESDTLTLPKIVVVGDQSAGKSSLIERMTGVTVPRDPGTCTRAPIHVNLRATDENSAWICEIYIENVYVIDSLKRKQDWVYTPQELGPWREMSAMSRLFCKIHHPDEVEDALRRAQAAVLNPNENPQKFLKGIVPKKNKHEFSPNIVRLDISGPDSPDLSFYDLPGVIASTGGDDDRHIPKLINSLVTKFLLPDSNIVLLALPMGVDPETCLARQLVVDAGALGRCVGVLTKPDLLGSGEPIDKWHGILDGKDFKLGFGYFVAKQASQAEKDAGFTYSQAPAREDEWFENNLNRMFTTPELRARCGTARLQEELSKLLVLAIKQALPKITSQIEEKIEYINDHLACLPEAPGNNALSIVSDIIRELDLEINRILNGDSPEFLKEWLELADTFRDDLSKLRPTLVVKPARSTTIPVHTKMESIDILSDSDVGQSGGKRGKAPLKTPSPTKKQRNQVFESPRAQVFTLEKIRDTITEFTTSGLPHSSNPKSTDRLIAESIQYWERPLTGFLEATERSLRGSIHRLLNRQLQPWMSTNLCQEARKNINDFISGRMEWPREAAMRALKAEQFKPLTRNVAAFEVYMTKEMALFQEKRHEYMSNAYLDEIEASGKKTTGVERSAKVKKVTKDQIGEDNFQKEVELMARVRAYYALASMSLVDYVSKTLQFDLLEQSRLHLAQHLREGLGLNDLDPLVRCKALLQQSAERVQLREELLREKDRYGEAQRQLNIVMKDRNE